jgi:hypothetical protein
MSTAYVHLVVRRAYEFSRYGGPPTNLAARSTTVGLLQPANDDVQVQCVVCRSFTSRRAAEHAAAEMNAAAQRDLDPLTFASWIGDLTTREDADHQQWLTRWGMPDNALLGDAYFNGDLALWYWCWYERIAQLSPQEHQQLVSELELLQFFSVVAVPCQD